MKVYGYDSTCVARGEMLAANVDADDVKFFGLDPVAASLQWEAAYTSFAKAKAALVASMVSEQIDLELIEAVKSFKASFIIVGE